MKTSKWIDLPLLLNQAFRSLGFLLPTKGFQTAIVQ